MSDRIRELLASSFVDGLIKVAVPALIGVSGYFFSFILDTSARIVAIENSRFTAKDGQVLADRVSDHDMKIGILDANQKRVMTSLDKVVDNQLVMIQGSAEIKTSLIDLGKRIERIEK